MKSITIKDWSTEDKPREKMMAQGKKALSNAELIALLLGTGVPGTDAVALAKEILYENDDRLTQLAQMNEPDFKKFKGIGTAKAVTIIAALELGRRMREEDYNQQETFIRNSEDLFRYIHPQLADLDREEFWVIFLNVRNKVIGKHEISKGGMTETAVDIRYLFRLAIENKATAIAVAHNHPSGSLTPSVPDDLLTKQITDAGNILRIKIIDHLIIGTRNNGKAGYYSYADHGKL